HRFMPVGGGAYGVRTLRHRGCARGARGGGRTTRAHFRGPVGFLMTGVLKGRRALISGGANGIGAAIARTFVREGAQTTIIDRDRHAGEAIARECGLTFIEADVSETETLRARVAAAGHFDVLVNNAGVDQHSFFTETSPDEWRRLLAINLEAVFATTYAVLPAMQSARF